MSFHWCPTHQSLQGAVHVIDWANGKYESAWDVMHTVAGQRDLTRQISDHLRYWSRSQRNNPLDHSALWPPLLLERVVLSNVELTTDMPPGLDGQRSIYDEGA